MCIKQSIIFFQALLLGIGLQHKSVDELEKEIELPGSQLMGLFNRVIRKVVQVSPRPLSLSLIRLGHTKPMVGCRRATVRLCSSCRAHVGGSLPNSTCWIGIGAVGEMENSDWMFSLANESVPENYSESAKNEHVIKGGTDRRLFFLWSFSIILICECFHTTLAA